jgi:tetratricopeptide (TPR) repeat protein
VGVKTILTNNSGDFMSLLVSKTGLSLMLCLSMVLGFFTISSAQPPKKLEQARKITQDAFNDFNKGKYQNTIEKCDKALKIIPNLAYANYLKSFALFKQGKHQLALTSINLAMQQGQVPGQAYTLRGQINFALKNFVEAKNDIIEATKTEPNNANLRRILGDIFYEEKNYKSALSEYQEAIRLEPSYANNGDIYYLIAWCQNQLKDFAGQGKNAVLAIQGKTRYQAESYFLAGESFQLFKKNDEAIVAFNEVLRLNPNFSDVYIRLSELYLNQYRLDEAAEITRKGIAINPKEAVFYVNLGWIYSLSNRHKEAITVAQEGVRLQPDNYMGYTNICRAHNDLKEFNLAIQNCNKALELKPNDGETFFYLARANDGLNKTKEAGVFYAKAVAGLVQYAKERPDSFEVLYLLGNAYYTTDRYLDAIRSYEKCLDICPNFPKARYNLGIVYLKQNKVSEARKQYEYLLKINLDQATKLKNFAESMKIKL